MHFWNACIKTIWTHCISYYEFHWRHVSIYQLSKLYTLLSLSNKRKKLLSTHSIHLNFSNEWNNWYIYEKFDILPPRIKRSSDLSDSQQMMDSRKRRSLNGKNADLLFFFFLFNLHFYWQLLIFFTLPQMLKVLIYRWRTQQKMAIVIIMFP